MVEASFLFDLIGLQYEVELLRRRPQSQRLHLFKHIYNDVENRRLNVTYVPISSEAPRTVFG